MFALSPVSVQVSKKIIIINKRGEVANKHWRQKGWKEIQELTNRAGRLFDTQECTPVHELPQSHYGCNWEGTLF